MSSHGTSAPRADTPTRRPGDPSRSQPDPVNRPTLGVADQRALHVATRDAIVRAAIVSAKFGECFVVECYRSR